MKSKYVLPDFNSKGKAPAPPPTESDEEESDEEEEESDPEETGEEEDTSGLEYEEPEPEPEPKPKKSKKSKAEPEPKSKKSKAEPEPKSKKSKKSKAEPDESTPASAIAVAEPQKSTKRVIDPDATFCTLVNRDWFVIAAGKKYSGKSTLVRSIVKYNYSRFGHIYLFCPTVNRHNLKASGYDFITNPDKYIITEVEREGTQIQALFDYQKNRKKQGKELIPMLIILDDCLGVIKFGSDMMKTLATSARHYGISLLFVTQHVNGITQAVRENCDMIFFGSMFKKNIKAAFDFQGKFNSLKGWDDYFGKNTKDYGLIKIDDRGECSTHTLVNTKKKFTLEIGE